MIINTRIFGEIGVDEAKIIHVNNGIIGFPQLKDYILIHDSDRGVNAGIRWLQSIQEPEFALPVMNPLIVAPDYNPLIEGDLLDPIGDCENDEMLILVSVTVPSDLTKMTVNLQAPIIIDVTTMKAAQLIVDTAKYPIKYPIYDILKKAQIDQGEGDTIC